MPTFPYNTFTFYVISFCFTPVHYFFLTLLYSASPQHQLKFESVLYCGGESSDFHGLDSDSARDIDNWYSTRSLKKYQSAQAYFF